MQKLGIQTQCLFAIVGLVEVDCFMGMDFIWLLKVYVYFQCCIEKLKAISNLQYIMFQKIVRHLCGIDFYTLIGNDQIRISITNIFIIVNVF